MAICLIRRSALHLSHSGSLGCRSRNIPDLHKDRSLKKLVGFDAQIFSQAPAHVMHATLQHIRRNYVSPRTYLAEACGFSFRDQQMLAKALRSGNSMM